MYDIVNDRYPVGGTIIAINVQMVKKQEMNVNLLPASVLNGLIQFQFQLIEL